MISFSFTTLLTVTALTLPSLIPGDTITYERPDEPILIHATITNYTARAEETDDTPTIAANGKEVFVGGIACPAQLPFGTKVVVHGVGEFECNDRMAQRYRYGKYFDIYSENLDAALAFGRQELVVEILR